MQQRIIIMVGIKAWQFKKKEMEVMWIRSTSWLDHEAAGKEKS